MRVAYLSCDFRVPVHGATGASIHVRELSYALHELGHEVVIVTPRPGGPAPDGFPVPVHELAFDAFDELTCELLASDTAGGPLLTGQIRGALYASIVRHRALELLTDFRPDVIYERFSPFGTAGSTLARRLGVPHLLEVNAPLGDEQARGRAVTLRETARRLERILLRSADRVVAVSSTLARWTVARGAESRRVTVVPNGVRVERFDAADRHRYPMRARLGIAGREVIGLVGTLNTWHDTDTLLAALARLRAANRPVHLLVVGDGPARERLVQRAAELRLEGRLTLAGAVPHDKVPCYLAAMDVATAPYRPSERFHLSPLALFEHLAAARPVVAADVGDIHHCVRPGRTGSLYRPGDADGLAAAIATLLRDPARAAELGVAGRKHVRACHSWRRNAARVLSLVEGGARVPVAS